jgi:hypothetical protein
MAQALSLTLPVWAQRKPTAAAPTRLRQNASRRDA